MEGMNTGFPQADAAAAFAREHRRHLWSAAAARLRLVRRDAGEMLPLDEVAEPAVRVAERNLGVQTIPLDSVVGTVDRRASDFDARFRPTSRRTERRWLSIALARRRGVALPPIDV